jgi:alkaline phosphatase/streptomycin-6-phosphatase
MAFDGAVRVGLDYTRTHPDTLIVVTADHAHTSQIVPVPTDADHGAGLFSVLRTKEQGLMAVSYGPNPYQGSQEHPGSQVRIAAQGPQASNVVGVIDQTDLFRLMLRALEATPTTSSHP